MRQRSQAQGFSLIEILVAVAIGLIGCVIIFQVFAVSENNKRSTTGGADAQVAGALALFTLERDIKMAGFGVNERVALGCNMLGYTSTRTPTNYNLSLVPVQIHAGATAAASDIISVMSGNPLDFAPGYGLTTASMAPGGNFRMENRGGMHKYDFLLVEQPSQANCSLVNISNLPLDGSPPAAVACGGSNTTDSVEICSTAKTDSDGVSRTYNQSGGLTGAPTYTVAAGTANTRYFNLGDEPAFNVYRVLNDALQVCNMRLANCASTAVANWTPIVENVVYMKAYYGMDTNDDGNVDTFDPRICRDTTGPAYSSGLGDNFGDQWTTSSDTNADGLHDTWTPGAPTGYDWSRVLAIRIAIVVRSQQYEKTDLTDGFNMVSGVIKLWPDAPGAETTGCVNSAALTGPASTGPTYTVPDTKYRYRVFETIIPLRNVLWMPG